MKKILFYVFTLLVVSQSSAQIKDGTRIFTATGNLFNASFSKSSSSDSGSSYSASGSNIVFSPVITYGKVKNNGMLSYGLSLLLTRYTSNDNKAYYPISVGPIISYQKFYLITPQVYFTPSATLSVLYSYSREKSSLNEYTAKGIASSFYFYPFSLTFSSNQKINFIISVGSASIGYNRSVNNLTDGTTSTKNTSSTFSINANFSGMGVGIQRLF
jgi:hypothetical protein